MLHIKTRLKIGLLLKKTKFPQGVGGANCFFLE